MPFNEQEYAAISNHYKTLQTGTAYKKPEIGLSVKADTRNVSRRIMTSLFFYSKKGSIMLPFLLFKNN